MSETLQIQFGNHLTEFIKKMRELFPSERKLFSKYYKYYRKMIDEGHRIDFIAEFIQYLSRYNKEIATCDEGLFSEEVNYYPGKPIQLMKGMDFKRLWRLEQMTSMSKVSIWQYLKTLYLMGTHVLKESEKYHRLIREQKEMMGQLLESLKYEKQIKKDAQKLIKSDVDEDSKGLDLSGLSGLGDLLTEDNIVTQIAMEIAKDFDFASELGNDPVQAINQLFSQNGDKFKEVLTRVSQKITRIAQDKGLTEGQLVEQAKQMGEKLMKMFKGIPGIEKLTQELMSGFSTMNLANPDASSTPPIEVNERLDKCREMIQTITTSLKDNMSQLGIENLDAFQKNMQSVMTSMSEQSK